MTPQQNSRRATWVGAVFRTRRTGSSLDVALLAVRLALAWIFVYYGGGKLFGWWDGPGVHVSASFFADTAHLRPGGFFAVVAGVIELGGGVAMALGAAARIVALALCGDMLVAIITVTGTNGFNSEKIPAGYEFNIALGVLALVVALVGAGRYSVDGRAERHLAEVGE